MRLYAVCFVLILLFTLINGTTMLSVTENRVPTLLYFVFAKVAAHQIEDCILDFLIAYTLYTFVAVFTNDE